MRFAQLPPPDQRRLCRVEDAAGVTAAAVMVLVTALIFLYRV